MRAGTELRELRGDIRHWRRGRVDTSLLEAVGDAYAAVFASLLLGSMVVSVVVNVRLVPDGLCRGGCSDARVVLPWLVGLAALTGVLVVARLFGPVFVTPAVGSWLLSTPLDRTAVLRPRLLWPVLVAAVIAGVVTVGAATLAGSACRRCSRSPARSQSSQSRRSPSRPCPRPGAERPRAC